MNHFPANIRLNEDVTSFVFVFRRRLDQDEHIWLTRTSSEDIFRKSSWRLDQDQYIRLGHTSSRCLQDVFKTFSRRLQDVSQKRLQDTFKSFSRRFQDVFETPSRCLATKSSRHLQDVLQRCLQDVLRTYCQVKLFLLKPFQDVFETYSKRS